MGDAMGSGMASYVGIRNYVYWTMVSMGGIWIPEIQANCRSEIQGGLPREYLRGLDCTLGQECAGAVCSAKDEEIWTGALSLRLAETF